MIQILDDINSRNDTIVLGWWENLTKECRLMNLDSPESHIRITAEIFMEIGAIMYILLALREAEFLGYKMFVENLVCAKYVLT